MRALKEWAGIVRALEDGLQTVILRKGGIRDASSGFAVESDEFLLYPTYEHQDASLLKPEHARYARLGDTNGRTNRITSFARVMHSEEIRSQNVLDKVSRYHIWDEGYVKSRMQWMPKRPLFAIFLDVYLIPEVIVPVLSEYAGCKSWLEIDVQGGAGKQVLERDDLDSRLSGFQEAVA